MEVSKFTKKVWQWQNHEIVYDSFGTSGPPVIFIHGFGASSGHWRKNLPVLGQNCRCWAIDLIGFGFSAKPKPEEEIDYTFTTWARQIKDFTREVVGDRAFLVGNSIGCIVALQAAVDSPELFLGVAAINCSLRMLHEKKLATAPWYKKLGAPWLQNLLSNQAIGNFFFQQIAKPDTVRKILLQAYSRREAVTDELVKIILEPAKTPGAVDVFLAFIRYSQGPLAEDLLPILPCRAILLWGTEDPWEPIALGKELAAYPTVEKFIALKDLGHCPQDEAPEIVNPILLDWILQRETISS